ncbi:hypothetical protein M0804_006355 [Polistes exclamans]|nr:hypothetical protein M0804_006355 [Polistes exclamans]
MENVRMPYTKVIRFGSGTSATTDNDYSYFRDQTREKKRRKEKRREEKKILELKVEVEVEVEVNLEEDELKRWSGPRHEA